MDSRGCLLWLSAVFLIYTVVLLCFFQDIIIELKLKTSASISFTNHVSGKSDEVGELEKQWQEKLIEDLFRETVLVSEDTPDQQEGPTTEFYRKHTVTPQLLDVEDNFGDQELRESVLKDMSPDEKESLTGRKETQSQNIANIIEEAVMQDPILKIGSVENESTEINAIIEPAGIEQQNNQLNQIAGGKFVEDVEKQNLELVVEADKLAKEHGNVTLAAANEPKMKLTLRPNDTAKLPATPTISSRPNNTAKLPAPPTISSRPKMVIVLTQSRHGSTWLMDVLGYGDEAVPVFEPLNSSKFLKMYAILNRFREEALADGYDPEIYKDWREVYLARICLCDWHGVLIPGKKDKHFEGIRGLKYKASRLNKDPESKPTEIKAREMCFKKESIMIPKTIRYYNISTLYKIQDFGCGNFKVVHLVRDPRAVMNSRMSVFHELYDGNALLGAQKPFNEGQTSFEESYMTEAAHWMCSHHLYNYKLGMNPPPWLKGRYKMVRYEDLAESPEYWTIDLLQFLGINYTGQYKEYVYNITHVKDRGERANGVYGVERQSSEIVDRWKEKLIEPHWRTIERVCAEMMRTFDYKPTFFETED
ncbi:carbohydrate sulfotransferase 3-like [Bolinopsis microptera]|uniref:carbohydrate sulfotransferase 3-like n=1 Tax=Bolinopsis microptera TaxID=2820187 RepID=UPI0030790B3C